MQFFGKSYTHGIIGHYRNTCTSDIMGLHRIMYGTSSVLSERMICGTVYILSFREMVIKGLSHLVVQAIAGDFQ